MIIAESDCLDPERVIGLYAKTKAEAGAYILEKCGRVDFCGCIVQPSGMIGPYDFGKQPPDADGFGLPGGSLKSLRERRLLILWTCVM